MKGMCNALQKMRFAQQTLRHYCEATWIAARLLVVPDFLVLSGLDSVRENDRNALVARLKDFFSNVMPLIQEDGKSSTLDRRRKKIMQDQGKWIEDLSGCVATLEKFVENFPPRTSVDLVRNMLVVSLELLQISNRPQCWRIFVYEQDEPGIEGKIKREVQQFNSGLMGSQAHTASSLQAFHLEFGYEDCLLQRGANFGFSPSCPHLVGVPMKHRCIRVAGVDHEFPRVLDKIHKYFTSRGKLGHNFQYVLVLVLRAGLAVLFLDCAASIFIEDQCGIQKD